MATHRFTGSGETPHEVTVDRTSDGHRVVADGAAASVRILQDDDPAVLAVMPDDEVGRDASAAASADATPATLAPPAPPAHLERVHVARDGDDVLVWHDGRPWRLPLVQRGARRAGQGSSAAAGDDIQAPMPGTVLSIRAASGDDVAANDVVVVMESMKMEMSLTAPRDGRIAEIVASEGDLVEMGAVLVRLAPADADASTGDDGAPSA